MIDIEKIKRKLIKSECSLRRRIANFSDEVVCDGYCTASCVGYDGPCFGTSVTSCQGACVGVGIRKNETKLD